MNDQQIRRQIAELKIEHRDLDEVIQRMSAIANVDTLQIKRLKKRKLALKDRILKLESQLLPDIIA